MWHLEIKYCCSHYNLDISIFLFDIKKLMKYSASAVIVVSSTPCVTFTEDTDIFFCIINMN